MAEFYTKVYFFILICFLGVYSGFGQTIIYTQDFETSNSGYTPSTTSGSGDIDVFNRANPNIGGNSTFIWAVEDTDSTPATITLDQIDVTGYSDFTFSIDLLAHHYQDWDSTDEMNIKYSIDSGTSQNLLSVQSTVIGDDFNTPAALDTDFDGEGDCSPGNILPALTTGSEGGCTVSASQFANFSSATIPLSGNSTLDITISFENLTSTDEGIYLDNIEVVGTPSGPTVGFDTASSTEDETNSTFNVLIPVTLSDFSSNVDLSVSVDAASTAEVADYTLNTTTLNFTSGGTQNVSLDINSDVGFDDETIILNLVETTIPATGITITTGQHTVTVNDDELQPSITLSETTLSGLDYVDGSGPSAEQTFTAEGSDLTSDITLTAPTNFEISTTSGSGFGTSVTLTPSSGSVAATTIYVRLAESLVVNPFYSGTLTATSTGATQQDISLSGEVTAAPPVNDDCSNAIALVNNVPAISGTLEASTVASPFTIGIDVWYSFTPSYNETYTITLSNFLGDADLYLFDQGNSCPTTTTDIASAITADAPEIISQNLIPGTTYYIAVVAFDVAAESTSFDIEVTAPPETTKVNFANASATVNEGDGSIDVDLTIVNEDATNATDVEVALTTGDAADIDSYTTQTLSFPAGSSANQTVTITLTDDSIGEGNETLTFTLQNISGGNNAQIGSQATFDLTIEDNDGPSLIITEVADPGDLPDGKFIEIYNNGDSPIDLGAQQIHIARQANGGNFSSVALTGTLNPDHLLVIGNSSNINSLYGFNADVDFGNISGNGDDGYFIYYNGDEITGTLLDAYGVVGQDGTGQDWEYEDSRAIRNNPKTVSPTATWTSSQWTITAADVADMTPGELENEYRYKNGWLTSGDPSGVSTVSDEIKIIEGTAVITSATTASNTVVNSGGVLDLDADLTSDILFNSDSDGSGQLADATGVTITGNVTVERYIPAGLPDLRRAYRLLTSAVNSTGSINANWQEGATSSTDNPEPGFGIHITGGDEADGFDQNQTENASMFTFDNTFLADVAGETQQDGWAQIPNTNTETLEAGKPYLTFIRGDRSVDILDNETTPTNTTLRATGQLATGTQSSQVMSGVDAFFSLLGNPYQAIVDFRQITFTGDVNTNHLFVWNPNLSTRGGYETITTAADQMIQPAQSFWVQNSVTVGTAPTVEFTESAKNTNGAVTAVFDEAQIARAKLSLYNSEDLKLDVLQLSFEDNANNGLDDFDAGKLINPDENLASLNNDNFMSVERRAFPEETEVIQLSTFRYQFTTYELRLDTENWNSDIDIFVADHYLNTTTPIDPEHPYSFSVDATIPESTAYDRFSLVFDNTTLSTRENAFGAGFSIFPNPTRDGLFSIKTPGLSGEVNVQMTNMLGQQVTNQNVSVEGQEVNVVAKSLSTGVYIVRLTQDEQTYSTKLIVE